MERNRNIAFDSDVEVDSLKDAVWRLTTRVYLLEDFIAERFGEVLTPRGFSKSTVTVPGTSSSPQTSKGISVTEGLGDLSPTRRRCKRKRRMQTTEVEGMNSKIHKAPLEIKSLKSKNNIFDISNNISLDMERNEINSPIALKDEMILSDYNESDVCDEFLNDISDNDSIEKNPDFVPLLQADSPSQNAPSKVKVQRNTQGKEQDPLEMNNISNKQIMAPEVNLISGHHSDNSEQSALVSPPSRSTTAATVFQPLFSMSNSQTDPPSLEILNEKFKIVEETQENLKKELERHEFMLENIERVLHTVLTNTTDGKTKNVIEIAEGYSVTKACYDEANNCTRVEKAAIPLFQSLFTTDEKLAMRIKGKGDQVSIDHSRLNAIYKTIPALENIQRPSDCHPEILTDHEQKLVKAAIGSLLNSMRQRNKQKNIKHGVS